MLSFQNISIKLRMGSLPSITVHNLQGAAQFRLPSRQGLTSAIWLPASTVDSTGYNNCESILTATVDPMKALDVSPCSK